MTLPLSKTLDLADYAQLSMELTVVDAHFASASPQHEHRRWEYAMTLRAMTMHHQSGYDAAWPHYDIGGGGSPFAAMATAWGRCVPPEVIDPSGGPSVTQPLRLDQYCCAGGPTLAAVVTCLSVLEHVDDLDRFLYHLACLTAPGGLLFLTADTCGCVQHKTDPHHFFWMRNRIFTERTWHALVVTPLLAQSFALLGTEMDGTYYGDHVYDYSFRSLALVKRP